MNEYLIQRDNTYLQHHGVDGQKWGIRRYQNEDGSYKPGAEGRYDPDGKSGHTFKNRVKAKLGMYGPNDDNPYVSNKRKQNRAKENISYRKNEKKSIERDVEKARKKTEKAAKKQAQIEERARKKAQEEKEAEEWLEDLRVRYENTQREKAAKKAESAARRKESYEKRKAESERHHQERQAKRDEKASKDSYKKVFLRSLGRHAIGGLAGGAAGYLVGKKTGDMHKAENVSRAIGGAVGAYDTLKTVKDAYNIYDYRKRKKSVQHSDLSSYDALYHSASGEIYGIKKNELTHWGIKGMHWGIRRYQNEDGTLTEAGKKRYREASEDAKEYARAKMFYGEGAGTRRKLIKAKVDEKSKDAGYKEAFDYAMKQQDMNKHADAAKRERKTKDFNKGAKRAVKVGASAAVTIGGILHATGYDKKLIQKGKEAIDWLMKERQYRKWKRAI